MKIKAAKIELTVGGTMITCHDAEIEIPDVSLDYADGSEWEKRITSGSSGSIVLPVIDDSNIKPEPVGKTDKPKQKARENEVDFCENCHGAFTKKTKKQRFCSTDCVRAYARRCKQPKLQQMITGVKNDYAPFTPQP